MTERERIAHHEASHAVLTFIAGICVASIDLDHADQQTGSSGGSFGSLFNIDLSGLEGAELEAAQLDKDIDFNGGIVAAGAASDAKLLGETPWEALQQQPGDLNKMRWLLQRARLSPTPEAEEARLRDQLQAAVDALENPSIWAAVKAVATAALKQSPLLGTDIKAIAKPILD